MKENVLPLYTGSRDEDVALTRTVCSTSSVLLVSACEGRRDFSSGTSPGDVFRSLRLCESTTRLEEEGRLGVPAASIKPKDSRGAGIPRERYCCGAGLQVGGEFELNKSEGRRAQEKTENNLGAERKKGLKKWHGISTHREKRRSRLQHCAGRGQSCPIPVDGWIGGGRTFPFSTS